MMHSDKEELPSGRDMVSAAALDELAFEAARPIAFHIDGEYLGETRVGRVPVCARRTVCCSVT